MTKSAPDEGSEYNAKIIKEFRANRGRVGGPWAGTTLILIHHIGAGSGVERITPLGCSSHGDGRFVIVASSDDLAPDLVLGISVQGQLAQTGVLGAADSVPAPGPTAVPQFQVGELPGLR